MIVGLMFVLAAVVLALIIYTFDIVNRKIADALDSGNGSEQEVRNKFKELYTRVLVVESDVEDLKLKASCDAENTTDVIEP